VILAKDLAQEIGIQDEPDDPEQTYEGLQFRAASAALLLLSHRIRFK
jgi:hypothetical protein